MWTEEPGKDVETYRIHTNTYESWPCQLGGRCRRELRISSNFKLVNWFPSSNKVTEVRVTELHLPRSNNKDAICRLRIQQVFTWTPGTWAANQMAFINQGLGQVSLNVCCPHSCPSLESLVNEPSQPCKKSPQSAQYGELILNGWGFLK